MLKPQKSQTRVARPVVIDQTDYQREFSWGKVGVKKKKKIFVQNQIGAFDSGKKMIPNLE
jgi:hypothetical protein